MKKYKGVERKKYKGAEYEYAEEGFWRIWFPDGWTKFYGDEKGCRALIRFITK